MARSIGRPLDGRHPALLYVSHNNARRDHTFEVSRRSSGGGNGGGDIASGDGSGRGGSGAQCSVAETREVTNISSRMPTFGLADDIDA